jgi:hypothetical protein
MQHMLITQFGAKILGSGNNPRHDMTWPKEFVQYVSFATIRNPYTRFLSFSNFFGHGQPIEQFARGGWPPMLKELEGVRLDYVVRLESLQDDFRKLPFVKKRHPFVHWTQSEKLRVSYGPTTQKLVRERCRRDFEVFGYDPDDISVISPKLL